MAENILAIDIGNTNTNIGIIDIGTLLCNKNLVIKNQSVVDQIIDSVNQIVSESNTRKVYTVRICSVIKTIHKELSKRLSGIRNIDAVHFVSSHTNLPMTIRYDNPDTLGADRIANMLYAIKKYPKQNIIIIDAGTAITIDLLTSRAEFVGGFILPGAATQLKSLHSNTSELPEVAYNPDLITIPPVSTQTAIVSGIYYEIAGGILHIISKLQETFPDTKRILTCGGAWKSLEGLVDCTYESIPEMTLIGTALYEE